MNIFGVIGKEILPPFALRFIHSRLGGWFGDYSSWAEAQKKACEGYDSDEILSKVRDALLKVKNGEAVYERDSVLFDEIEYSWALLASLMWVAARSEGKLRVLDFGGSLGSTYYQNRRFLSALNLVEWNIVEQERFVECGKKHFEDDILKFFLTANEAMRERPSQILLLGSTLQYIEHPFELLDSCLSLSFKYILFDRTPFVVGKKRDIISLQKVPSFIYKASYPSWIFYDKKLIKHIEEKGFSMVCAHDNDDILNRSDMRYGGYLFERSSS